MKQKQLLEWARNVNGVGIKRLAEVCAKNPTFGQGITIGPDGKKALIIDLVIDYQYLKHADIMAADKNTAGKLKQSILFAHLQKMKYFVGGDASEQDILATFGQLDTRKHHCTINSPDRLSCKAATQTSNVAHEFPIRPSLEEYNIELCTPIEQKRRKLLGLFGRQRNKSEANNLSTAC